eukprot:106427_1
MYCNRGHEIISANCDTDKNEECNECGLVICSGGTYFSCNHINEMINPEKQIIEYILCETCYDTAIKAIIKFNELKVNHKSVCGLIQDKPITIRERSQLQDELYNNDKMLTKIDGKSIEDVGLTDEDIQFILKYNPMPFTIMLKQTKKETNEHTDMLLDQFSQDEFIYGNKDFDDKGIIYAIGTNFGENKIRNDKVNNKDGWTNPAKSLKNIPRKIILTSYPDKLIKTHSDQDLSDIVDKQGKEIALDSESKPNAWICLEFVSIKICPWHYTLRDGSPFNSRSFLTNWDFEGSTDGKHWTLLDRHQQDRSLERSEHDEKNEIFPTATWGIECDEFYNMFRIRMTGKNAGNDYKLCISGLEIYGDAKDRKLNEVAWVRPNVFPKETLQDELQQFGVEYEEIRCNYNQQAYVITQVMENSDAEKKDLKKYDYFTKKIYDDDQVVNLEFDTITIRCKQGHDINVALCCNPDGLECTICHKDIKLYEKHYSCNHINKTTNIDKQASEVVFCQSCYFNEVKKQITLEFKGKISNYIELQIYDNDEEEKK